MSAVPTRHLRIPGALAALATGVVLPLPAPAQSLLPALSGPAGDASLRDWSLPLDILVLMTALTVLPSILLGMTAFTRIIIVLSILRQALGTQQTPPNQVMVALALFLTAFVMGPTLDRLNTRALDPWLSGGISQAEALDRASDEMRGFMLENTRAADLTMFADLAGDAPYAGREAVPFRVLLPAFMTSEIKTAFEIGFLLFLPFLVIDIVIASILMALGMMMVSPMLVALPVKLLLFVMVDGWAMTLGSIAAGYGVGG
ncbi:flagellar type III secretion system pore protein FliP [Frigidibacter oleivorans]|uniref:flagellar type III secretion system pore protein FliP n=1 Tax=Frigidibacter oleivorans TaxID=2487129 RepID=UPI000F8EB02B|nr:flagellar type III secretion system pore protein FliP [Frigidibacter oleivorans]